MKTEKTRLYLIFAGLAFAAALAAQLPSLSPHYLWDDAQFIKENNFAGDCANLGKALNPVYLLKVLPVRMSARPVVNATLIADACSGAGPLGMRLTNALLQACNAALLFLLLLTLCGSAPGALFGALVFALHPVSAEAVQIITFRSHLLGFFFFTSGLVASVFFARKPGKLTGATAASAYFLAVLSVETPVILPGAALLAIFFDSGRPGLKRAAPLLAAFILIGSFYLWFRAPRAGYELPGSSPGIASSTPLYPPVLLPPGPPTGYSWHTSPPWREVYASRAANLYTMSAVAAGYMRTLLLPAGLSTDYNPRVIRTFRGGALPLALCLTVLAGAAVLFYRGRLSGLALLLIITALLPALNIWPLYNIKADRYLYLPLAGFSLLAAAAFRRIWEAPSLRRTAGLLTGAAWLAFLFSGSLTRSPQFKDDISLFSAAVRAEPSSPRAHANLAAAWLREGSCGKALPEARLAYSLDPDGLNLRLRLAYALLWCGNGAQSARLMQGYPEDPDSLMLSALLALKTDRNRAADLLNKALVTAPNRRDIRLALALAENKSPAAEQGDREELAELTEALKKAGLLF